MHSITGFYTFIQGKTPTGNTVRSQIFDTPQEAYSAAFDYIIKNNLI
jgi:hypothetical protein